jgi:hypothetical protein
MCAPHAQRMPRIIVTADESGGRVLHSERVSPSDFETEHFRTQLAERVAWAVEDAAREPAIRAAAPREVAAGTAAGTPAPIRAV